MEKDVVLCEVPFGGVLFINNLIPHRRYDISSFACSTYVQHIIMTLYNTDVESTCIYFGEKIMNEKQYCLAFINLVI